MNSSNLVLYHCDSSLASQKVRLYLEDMSIPWTSEHIDLRKQEHITSDYRDINPDGTVPSLKDESNGKLICNSTEILVYLNEMYTPEERQTKPPFLADAINFCRSHEGLHDPSLRTLSYFYNFMRAENVSNIERARILELADRHPNKERGDFLRRVVTHSIKEEEIKGYKLTVIDCLEEMENLLSYNQSSFLFSSQYTFADSVATASLFRIDNVGMGKNIKAFDAVTNYYQAMQQRASFTKANMC